MPNSLPHDQVIPFAESEKGKKEQVAEMFDRIACRYDFMNRFLSGRIDLAWRKKAINRLKKGNPKHILDIATGTADMAILACRQVKPERIDGIDISAEMLKIGNQKIEKEGLKDIIHLHNGDAETINFPENTFDAGMVAFGVRNFENLEKGLSEILRVMKPGAQLVILEFSKPKQPFRSLYNLYTGWLAPKLASLFRQDKAAYQYLNDSVKAFPERTTLVDILNKTGYKNTSYQPLSLGICCIYSGVK